MMQPLIAAGIAFAIALAVTPLLRSLAHRLQLLDVPNERSSHSHPTPRSGGYAIAAGMLAAVLVSGAVQDRAILVICIAVVAVAVAAAADEFRPIPNAIRFVIQLLIAGAAAEVAPLFLQSIDLPFAGRFFFGGAALVVSVFWIAGVLNGFNFMDGLNGIASVEAIVCGAALCALSMRLQDVTGAVYAAAIAGAAAGFLPWNLPSGSIFMGDVGSTALGFSIAALVLRIPRHGGSVIAAALSLMPFLFDSGVTLVRRAIAGEKFFYAHRSHFYQRLNKLGWSHAAVTSLWGAMAAVCAGVALIYDRLGEAGRAAALLAVLSLHVVAAGLITAAERSRRSAGGPPR